MVEILPEIALGVVDIGIIRQGDMGVPHGLRGFADTEAAHGLVILIGCHPDLLILIEFVAGIILSFRY